MVGVGHQDAFLRPRLSARYRFHQGILAGTRGNGRDAPRAVIGVAPCEQARSIRSGTFDQHQCGKRREEGGALSVCAFVPETELRKNVRGRLMPAAVKLECAR